MNQKEKKKKTTRQDQDIKHERIWHTNMTEALSHTKHDNTSHMLIINITEQEHVANKHNHKPETTEDMA